MCVCVCVCGPANIYELQVTVSQAVEYTDCISEEG